MKTTVKKIVDKKRTKKVNEIINEVLLQYNISDKERRKTLTEINGFIAELSQLLKKNKITAKVMLGGSAAKSTYIKNDFDCDIFVQFDYNKYIKEEHRIAGILQKALNKFNPIVVHGSRDYFHIKKDDVNYEIVPVLNIKDPKKAVNVTDMSPLHVQWVKKHITGNIRDQIIITKLFLKANNLYGAESYIKAFSGHVVDILLIYYGSFLGFLRAALRWKEFQVIDVERYNTAKWLNESKISPLIVIDPLLSSRNACAALSKEKFLLFKDTAKKFLDNPQIDFFERKIVTAEQIMQKLLLKYRNSKNKKIVLLEITPADGKEDIVLTKALKTFEYLKKKIYENNFCLYSSGIEFGSIGSIKQVLCFFITDNKMLEKQKLIKGPITEFKDGCKSFAAKHKTAFLKAKQWFAYEERKYLTIESLIENLQHDNYVIERIKAIRVI